MVTESVRDSPTKPPANTTVAPNSPKARTKAKTAAPKIPGQESGNITHIKVRHGDNPRVDAVSKKVLSIDLIATISVRNAYGNETMLEAKMAPKKLKDN